MTPKRPAGVTIAAIASILGSALFVLMAVAMLLVALSPTAPPGAPPFLKTVAVVMSVVMLLIAAWGITTAVGLFRLRTWARWSIVVFSVLLVFVGGTSALTMAFVPLPPNPQAPAGLMTGVRIGVAGFYAVLALLGTFWLFYFNRAAVRTQFGPSAKLGSFPGNDGPGGRPLSISMIAWLLIIGGVSCALAALLPFPAMAFGLTFTGAAARVFYVLFGAGQIWLGAALLRLNPVSRVLAMTLFAYNVLNVVLFVARPGYADRFHAMLEALPAAMRMPTAYDTFPSTTASLILGSVLSIVPIWFLIARREAFIRRHENA